MVFTRSMLKGVMSLVFSPELDRIQRDYAEEKDVKFNKEVKKVKKVKFEVVEDNAKDKVKSELIIGSAFDYIIEMKGSSFSSHSVTSPSIDFDDAHDEWTANKKRKTNGNYVYICGAPLKNGKQCRKDCCDKIGLYSGCRQHYSWEEYDAKVTTF